MPWLGRARRKTRPSLEGAFGWLLKSLLCGSPDTTRSPERPGPFAKASPALTTWRFAASASLHRSKDVPAWALPGGKEHPSLVGTIGWLRGGLVFGAFYWLNLAVRVNVPGLDGPGGKPIQAAGDILPIQSSHFQFVSGGTALVRRRQALISSSSQELSRVALTYMVAANATHVPFGMTRRGRIL